MLTDIQPDDKVFFPMTWRTLLLRNGKLYSVNQWDRDYVEIRYEIDSQNDADYFGIKLSDYIN